MKFSNLLALPVVAVSMLVSSTVALAQAIPASTPTFGDKFGNVTNIQTLMNFVVNLMRWIGWSGVVVGIVIVLGLLIYKLIGSDDNADTMKKVQSGITKAVIMVIIGLLLISVTFLINFVAGVFNFGTTPGGTVQIGDVTK